MRIDTAIEEKDLIMEQKMARENYESGYVPRNPATQMSSFCQRCSENGPAVAAPDLLRLIVK